MGILLFIFTSASAICFWLFLRGKYNLSPLWIMLSAWFISIGISQLSLSRFELVWPGKYWYLIFISLLSFSAGVLFFDEVWREHRWWKRVKVLTRENLNLQTLRTVIYILFLCSIAGLILFYQKAGNFPLLSSDPDAFRFEADERVPGLINYVAQLARIFIPLSFFLIFSEKYNFKKHSDLVFICLWGIVALILFTSRTQIFFIDLWVMAMYLFMRKPNLKQAARFYPVFLLISIVVLAAVPLIRQYKSYGEGYLANVTGIDNADYNPLQNALLPIYIGVSFNQQALLHAWQYYQTHPLQYGKVTLDPFTNILGLHQFKSNFDLGEIFYSWWNTGTYLFPFVQDFGEAAFYLVPFIIAAILTLLWHYWKENPNFLSINYYAYAMFFIVMTVYLSFTVRAEMYIDLALLFVIYLFVSKSDKLLR